MVIIVSLFVLILEVASGGREDTPTLSQAPSSPTTHTLPAEANGTIQLLSLLAFRSDRDGNPEIYTMNVDGSAQTRITNHPSEDDTPASSPDGKRIAFTSGRDGSKEESEIYVMDVDGSNQTLLTNRPGFDAFPKWSPDGSKKAFHHQHGR